MSENFVHLNSGAICNVMRITTGIGTGIKGTGLKNPSLYITLKLLSCQAVDYHVTCTLTANIGVCKGV